MDDFLWSNLIGGFLGGFAGTWLGGRLLYANLHRRIDLLEQLAVRRSP